jgi:hypothetical protein
LQSNEPVFYSIAETSGIRHAAVTGHYAYAAFAKQRVSYGPCPPMLPGGVCSPAREGTMITPDPTYEWRNLGSTAPDNHIIAT